MIESKFIAREPKENNVYRYDSRGAYLTDKTINLRKPAYFVRLTEVNHDRVRGDTLSNCSLKTI